MKVSANRSYKKRVQKKKESLLKKSARRNNFLDKHKLQNLKTVEAILDDENITYKSSIPLSKQILKDVPFVKLIHDNITKKKLYLMRLNTRIDLDDNNILTDPKMIKQIPYVNMQALETPEVSTRKSCRSASKKKSPMVHSTPTRTSSRRTATIVISSDDEDTNELSTEYISPIKKRYRKSDLSLKEKNLLSPSIMKASNEKSNVKKRVSFAESVSFLDDELEDSDESYSNERSKSSTSKDENVKTEVINRKSKRLSQNSASASLINKIVVPKKSAGKKVKSSASQNKDVKSAGMSKKITDLKSKPMPASKRRSLMERIRREEAASKKEKPMPASKKRLFEEKQKKKKSKLDISKQDNSISEKSTQENKELEVLSENENEALHKNKNSVTQKKVVVKPMPASVKRKLLSKMLKKPMPASKRRLLEEKYSEEELAIDTGNKRKLTELPESSSPGIKKLKRKDLLKPMPASQRRKLENRLKKQEDLNEQIQNSCNSDDDNDADFDNVIQDSECDSPIPSNMSAEMLHKRDHVSKSKKRYSLDCSGLETKNLQSEFSSEDEQNENIDVESLIVLNSDDDNVKVDETKEEVPTTEKVACRKTGRKRVPRIPFVSPANSLQIVKMKRRIRVLNKSILKLKKKREVKIRFKKTKEYKCDVCLKAYMEKCNLQLHFLKHVQPLEIEIRLYRYKLPIHFNVTPYNEQKFLKSKREMNRFLNEDINNLVNKYVAHRDDDTDDQKTSSQPESMDETEEHAVILDNILISPPTKTQVVNNEVETENKPVESNMNTSVEPVIQDVQSSQGSQCETVNDETKEMEETSTEEDNNTHGQKDDATTSEQNVENELDLTKERQLSTVEASTDNVDNPVVELSEVKPDEKKSEEESDNSKSELEKVPSVDNNSQLNINEDTTLITDSDKEPIDDSKEEEKVDELLEEKQDNEIEKDDAIEKDSSDVEENIVNSEAKSIEIVDISEDTSSKDRNVESIEGNNFDSDIQSKNDKCVDISDKLIDASEEIEETQSKCVEISEKITGESLSTEVEKTNETNLTESLEEVVSKLDHLSANSIVEELTETTASSSKDPDILDVSAEKEVTSEENVEIEASTTEKIILEKETDDVKENESVDNEVEESETEDSATKSSGTAEETTTAEVDEVSDVVESVKNNDALTDEAPKKSVEEENRDHEDKDEDLHLCVESDDTQDAGISEDTTKKTAVAQKDEDEDKLVTSTVAKSGDFETFLKCFDTESLSLPSTSAEVVMSQAELINTLESPKENRESI